MGTDRFEKTREPCLCGKGEIVIHACEPDHSFAKLNDRWIEGSIQCDECLKSYDIENTQTMSVLLVRKEDQRRSAEHKKRVSEAERVFRECSAMVTIRAAVVAHLNRFGSVAAQHRAVDAMRPSSFGPVSIGTFRKDMRGGVAAWVAHAVHEWNALRVAQALGLDDSALRREMDAVASVRSSGPDVSPVRVFG